MRGIFLGIEMIVHRDEIGILHCLTGPAIIWPSGLCQYWVNGEIPLTVMNILITHYPMVFDAELIPEVVYPFSGSKAYRFDDMDEFSLAVLYYS
jgi:hypothetical protein